VGRHGRHVGGDLERAARHAAGEPEDPVPCRDPESCIAEVEQALDLRRERRRDGEPLEACSRDPRRAVLEADPELGAIDVRFSRCGKGRDARGCRDEPRDATARVESRDLDVVGGPDGAVGAGAEGVEKRVAARVRQVLPSLCRPPVERARLGAHPRCSCCVEADVGDGARVVGSGRDRDRARRGVTQELTELRHRHDVSFLQCDGDEPIRAGRVFRRRIRMCELNAVEGDQTAEGRDPEATVRIHRQPVHRPLREPVLGGPTAHVEVDCARLLTRAGGRTRAEGAAQEKEGRGAHRPGVVGGARSSGSLSGRPGAIESAHIHALGRTPARGRW
jgi:hypothetical protein